MNDTLCTTPKKRVLSPAVTEYILMMDRTVSTTANGGPKDRYTLLELDGVAIADIDIVIDAVSLSNLRYSLRVEGAVRPDAFVVGSAPISAITASGYQQAVASTRADFAARTHLVLEVEAVAAGLGTACFSIIVGVRQFT